MSELTLRCDTCGASMDPLTRWRAAKQLTHYQLYAVQAFITTHRACRLSTGPALEDEAVVPDVIHNPNGVRSQWIYPAPPGYGKPPIRK